MSRTSSRYNIVELVKKNFIWEVKDILQKKPNEVSSISYNFETLLMIAIQNGSDEMIEILLQYYANPNYTDNYGNDSYIKAVLLQRSYILKQLFEKSRIQILDINNVYSNEKTLLMCAISNIDIRCILVLLKNGANPNIIINNTKTALTELFTYNRSVKNNQIYNNKIYNIFQLLVEYNIDLNFKTLEGVSYLHMAIIMNFDRIIQILVRKISLESIDIYGQTPLYMLLNMDRLEI